MSTLILALKDSNNIFISVILIKFSLFYNIMEIHISKNLNQNAEIKVHIIAEFQRFIPLGVILRNKKYPIVK